MPSVGYFIRHPPGATSCNFTLPLKLNGIRRHPRSSRDTVQLTRCCVPPQEYHNLTITLKKQVYFRRWMIATQFPCEISLKPPILIPRKAIISVNSLSGSCGFFFWLGYQELNYIQSQKSMKWIVQVRRFTGCSQRVDGGSPPLRTEVRQRNLCTPSIISFYCHQLYSNYESY